MLQTLHKVRGGGELNPMTLLDQRISNATGQVSFAHATGAEQQDILGLFDPVGLLHQGHDLRFGDALGIGKVEAAELLCRW